MRKAVLFMIPLLILSGCGAALESEKQEDRTLHRSAKSDLELIAETRNEIEAIRANIAKIEALEKAKIAKENAHINALTSKLNDAAGKIDKAVDRAKTAEAQLQISR
jgi:multidrug resistance efflux pump